MVSDGREMRLPSCAHCGSDNLEVTRVRVGEVLYRNVACVKCGASAPEHSWRQRMPSLGTQPNPDVLREMLYERGGSA